MFSRYEPLFVCLFVFSKLDLIQHETASPGDIYGHYHVNVDNPPAKTESVIVCGMQPLSLSTVCVYCATKDSGL